ncbi:MULTISPECIES: thioredoxin domain-containing protein [unclassified Pseudoclavibacter]|uniref:DsbA family protein n=1 Tax=unclassified Pseudoclavibacter TaxID=2615177 RepID=UPI000CE7319D|nr:MULTISPECIES: thioredoxin domain-containing protein [unclassified Pseudoclavibacter]MBF4552187.1 thioredoxin domain-containing protein [Pseudoclavibacter sp. VKM Ac-2888]PPF32964.1 hypothetical protein C5E05_18480 [Pseudoclavibacter sp. AY1H1]PPF77475.1 hypothetical protein C5B99_03490 [Pseudoclavibacter sp. Z016]PPG04621.1 hypothetical protein C5E06_04115 [Pseudoclavibacter sp. RFBI5]
MADKNREHIQKLREEANAIRKQEEARAKRTRVLTQVGIIVGAVVVLGAIVLLAVFGSTWFGKKIEISAEGNVAVARLDGSTVEQPIQVVDNSAIVVGAADAPVKIDYYYDYSCPHCVDYHEQTGAVYNDLVAAGEMQVTYHAINIVAPYGAEAAAAIASTVAYEPSAFFAVHDGLFGIPAQTQTSWGPADYSSALSQLGVTNPEALAAATNGEFSGWAASNTTASREAGVSGTPSIFVDGELQQTPPDVEALMALAGTANTGE